MIFILRDQLSGKYVAFDALRGWGLTSDVPFALRIEAPNPTDRALRYGMDALTELWGGKTKVQLQPRPAPELKLQ